MFTNFPRQPLWVRTRDETAKRSSAELLVLALPAKDTVMKKLENVKQIKATVDLYWIVPTSLRLSINSMFLSDQVILHILLGKEYLTSLWGIL